MASWVNFDTRIGWHQRGYRVKFNAEPMGEDRQGNKIYHEADVEEKRPLMVSPREITQEWPTYKVNSQIADGQNIVCRTIKAPNEAELFKLLRRLLNADLSKIPLLEIMRENKDNTTTVIIGDLEKPWPKAGIEHLNLTITAKLQEESKANTSSSTSRADAIVSDLMALRAEAASRAKEAIVSGPALPPSSSTPATTSNKPKEHDDDELGRPLFCYKREVA